MDTLIGSALDTFLTVTGRLVVGALSFGRWRAEGFSGEEGRIHGAAGALSFVRDGRRVITTTGQLFFGLAFYVLLAGLGVLYAVAV